MDEFQSPQTQFEEPKRNNVVLIIVIIAIVLLCCCLLVVGAVWFMWTYGDQIFGLTYQQLQTLL